MLNIGWTIQKNMELDTNYQINHMEFCLMIKHL